MMAETKIYSPTNKLIAPFDKEVKRIENSPRGASEKPASFA